MLPTVPPPTPTPWPTPTPTPVPTQGCDVAATKSSDWGSGFTLTLTITNTGSRTVDGWRLTWTFDGDQRITNVWGATAYQNFQSVRLTNLSSNGTIESGQSVTAGVNVSYRFSNDIPTKFALNGITCQ